MKRGKQRKQSLLGLAASLGLALATPSRAQPSAPSPPQDRPASTADGTAPAPAGQPRKPPAPAAVPPVIKPPAAGTMPVIKPPMTGAMPVIAPPADGQATPTRPR